MNSEKFFTWCRVAVKGIKYRPDRDAVHEELYEHLEDRYESFRCRGLEHEEAVDKTVEAMGSAEELAPLLAKAHRPFWPYMLVISRALLIVALIIIVFPFERGSLENALASVDVINPVEAYDVYTDSEYYSGDGYYAKRMLYLEPNCTANVDGYTVRVTNVAWWRRGYVNNEPTDRFYFRIEITKPSPWEELANSAVDFFWAEDSLGNHYHSASESGRNKLYLVSSGKTSGFFSDVYEFSASGRILQDAQWIDLHYDRDGRNFVLRIDLMGGEEV